MCHFKFFSQVGESGKIILSDLILLSRKKGFWSVRVKAYNPTMAYFWSVVRVVSWIQSNLQLSPLYFLWKHCLLQHLAKSFSSCPTACFTKQVNFYQPIRDLQWMCRHKLLKVVYRCLLLQNKSFCRFLLL